MTAGQLKQHARLLRERYNDPLDKDYLAAHAQAEKMMAEAELLDAENDTVSQEEDCTIETVYPIFGKITWQGGKRISIEHEWEQHHVNALKTKGIDMAFEWTFDPRSGVNQGKLYRIYIGTKTEGPRVCWYEGRWQTLRSRGNFGNNWACGGNWSTIGSITAETLNEVAPDLDAAIKEVVQ